MGSVCSSQPPADAVDAADATGSRPATGDSGAGGSPSASIAGVSGDGVAVVRHPNNTAAWAALDDTAGRSSSDVFVGDAIAPSPPGAASLLRGGGNGVPREAQILRGSPRGSPRGSLRGSPCTSFRGNPLSPPIFDLQPTGAGQ